MRRTRRLTAVALGAVAAMTLVACGGPSTTGTGSGGSGGGSGGQAADANGVHNPSDATGGTIRMANSGDWDSLDPADTYYAYAWNFARLYGRSLVMFKSAPGKEGATLVPDLAESARQAQRRLHDSGPTRCARASSSRTARRSPARTSSTPSSGRWTRRPSPTGPPTSTTTSTCRATPAPYQDSSPDKLGLKAIDTPDDRTIVFKLAKPFSGFDYFAQLPSTIPVPQAKDTGSKYKEHVVSTGPYMFGTNDLGKSFALVRNPNWDQATDPNRKPLPDRIEVALNVNSDDIDNRLVSGDLDVAGRGLRRRAGGAGADPRRPDPQGEHRQRAGRPQLVHLRQRRGRAAGQHPLPQGRAATPTTGPATSAPTAARPAARSRRTCCPR